MSSKGFTDVEHPEILDKNGHLNSEQFGDLKDSLRYLVDSGGRLDVLRANLRLSLLRGQETLSPIRLLPDDILREIFFAGLRRGPWNPTNLTQIPWVAGKVCQRWRNIVLSTPLLWSSLIIAPTAASFTSIWNHCSGHPTKETRWAPSSLHTIVEECLLRSGSCDLSLTFSVTTCWTDELESLLEILRLVLAKHGPRLRTLILRFLWSSNTTLAYPDVLTSENLKDHFPNLQQLEIAADANSSSHLAVLVGDTFSVMPRIQDIVLNVPTSLRRALLLDGQLGIFHASYLRYTSGPRLADVLEVAQHVTQCQVNPPKDPADQAALDAASCSDIQILHPHLRSLSCIGTELNGLQLPNLQNLIAHVKTSPESEAFYSFLGRHSEPSPIETRMQLVSLQVNGSIQARDIPQLLVALVHQPTITSLDVSLANLLDESGGYSGLRWTSTAMFESMALYREFPLLPNLQHLAFASHITELEEWVDVVEGIKQQRTAFTGINIKLNGALKTGRSLLDKVPLRLRTRLADMGLQVIVV